MREWDVEFLERTQSLYPAKFPPPKKADTERNTQVPRLVPTETYRYGIIGRFFQIRNTHYN